MNKTAIRNFAIWARNKLIADISYKAGLMGITKDGIADVLPQSTSGVEFYDIGTAEPYAIRGEEIEQRKGLVQIIKQKEKTSDFATAYTSVIEEVAYTWFNRLIAVRFMEVNDYMPSHVRVLSSETGKLEPDLVTTPFDAELDFSDAEKQQIIQLKNDNKLDEVFRLLFIKQCNALHGILPRLFENTSDYSELLLNVSFIDQDGAVYHLVHDIDEDDFNIEKGGQVEIIGWLYQYYNTELKDETFALLKNNVKVTKERIPSATQLFTPDWIVRYMVENSLGRLWVEGHPNDTLKSGWKYYLDEAEQEASVKAQLEEIKKEYANLTPEDIKVIDPCMGSGHILVYAFDVLMQIYESTGYTQRDAAKSILENNLYGLDIDERAAQLAYFAVMMKARQYNRRILNGETDCSVFAIKESNSFDRRALVKLGDDLCPIAERVLDAFIDAKEYGSIINVNVTLYELNLLKEKLDDVDRMSDYGNLIDMLYAGVLCTELNDFIEQARVMIQKYDAIVTNPPYMGAGNMNEKLTKYVKSEYPDTKADISTVFMEKTLALCKENGLMSMINIPVWMFITSYEKLRLRLIKQHQFVSMLHLGRGVFGSDFGTTAFVICKRHLGSYKGQYMRLFNEPVEVTSVEAKESWFFERKGYHISSQEKYLRIPGNPIAYWISDEFEELLASNDYLAEHYDIGSGLSTSDNERFLRCFWELDANIVSFDGNKNKKKWFLFQKGGDYRKWYGNLYYVVNWENDGEEIKYWVTHNPKDPKTTSWSRRIFNTDLYFLDGITWGVISSGNISFRVTDERSMISNGAGGIFNFIDNKERDTTIAALNSVVWQEVLKVINPTINCSSGVIQKTPTPKKIDSELVQQCINISRIDWDSFETSIDFKKHPLL